MTRWMPAVLAALCAALAAAVVVQAAQLRQVKREADHLRARLERLESRQRETPAAIQAAVERVQEQVARVEKAAAVKAPPPAEAPVAEAEAPPAIVTEEDIRKIVDEKVEEKLKAQGEKQQGGDRKMPLHDLAKELNLDPLLQPKVAEIANAAKKEIFEILQTPRADGTHLADDLLDSFLSGDQARVQQIFLRVITEKIPGTEVTYLLGAGKVQEKAYQGLEQVMGPDLFARYKHMSVHPENIETGYDPWGEYLVQRGPR